MWFDAQNLFMLGDGVDVNGDFEYVEKCMERIRRLNDGILSFTYSLEICHIFFFVFVVVVIVIIVFAKELMLSTEKERRFLCATAQM